MKKLTMLSKKETCCILIISEKSKLINNIKKSATSIYPESAQSFLCLIKKYFPELTISSTDISQIKKSELHTDLKINSKNTPLILLSEPVTEIRQHNFTRTENSVISKNRFFLNSKPEKDAKEAAIEELATMVESKDAETGGHIRRTKEYIKLLAVELKKNILYKNILTDDLITRIYKSAPLHDIGKIAIPEEILTKKGPLTENEFKIMKTHTVIGKAIVKKAEQKTGKNLFLTTAGEIAYSHQEKWNGSGYPLGLKEKQIPISARLMAVADVYDALISKRVYKEPYSHNRSVRIIQNLKGTHFDPVITDTFISINEQFKKIACKFRDYNSPTANLSELYLY
ncbi:MAG: HD-GYP domain-containing protein [Thermodesulfobacteriota bacterium]